jgi:hypothetical protein
MQFAGAVLQGAHPQGPSCGRSPLVAVCGHSSAPQGSAPLAFDALERLLRVLRQLLRGVR